MRIDERAGRIKLLDGLHLTSTEKKHILYILENGLVEDFLDAPRVINHTKSYQFFSVEENIWEVRIGDYGVETIGRDPSWHYNTVVIEHIV